MLLALGSNLTSQIGSPEETLWAALNKLEARGGVIRHVSPFYSTPAFPAGNGADFVNAAAEISAEWSPQEALSACHAVEMALGRTREVRWGERTVDIDLIADRDTVLPDARKQREWVDLPIARQMSETPDDLILPHPRMQDRAFVLVPLCDIAPDWVHPVLGKSVRQMRDALDHKALAEVRRLE